MKRRVFIVLIVLLLLVLAGSMALGSRTIGPWELVETMLGQGNETRQMVLLSFRLPRVLLALLVGMGVSVSGVLLQGVLRNDLAAPGILGVSSGANLGVTLVLLSGGMQLASPWIVPAASVGGAMAAVLLVCLLAGGGGSSSPTRLLLTGVAVSASLGAFTLVLSLNVDRQVYARALAWTTGSFNKADWNYVAALAGWLGLMLPLAWAAAPVMNLLRLGEDTAVSLGLAVSPWRSVLLVLAVVLSATSMALAGSIVFLGLLAPHIGRRLVGPNHGPLIPAAALIGAILLVTADTLGRTMLAPAEIPAGVSVGVLGGLYFLYLLMTTSG